MDVCGVLAEPPAVDAIAGDRDAARRRSGESAQPDAQLGLRGEVEWTVTSRRPGEFGFRVQRPGHVVEVKADLQKKVASAQHIQLNAWGVMHVLHTFSGVRMRDPRTQRDWILTSVWSGFMDASALGLMLMVLGSIWMWWGLKAKRWLGVAFLLSGILTCGFFVAGLRWLTS